MGIEVRNNIKEIRGKWEMPFEYSYGQYYPIFYDHMKEGEIWTVRCSKCQRAFLPPRPYCGNCFEDVEEEWVKLSDEGSVRSYTVVRMPYSGQPTQPPYCYILVVLDGCSNEFHHLLGEADPSQIKVGMRVKAVWRPEEERTGSVHDIKYFKPI
ncbi:MAG: Zn-ribbon domain-containing OB-fold protein [Actinobacteria bacterium]|nr:Zn-ribbon domain-containing OB-fold protein [Actinomycetota bacterium]